jgi:hypothetical protein
MIRKGSPFDRYRKVPPAPPTANPNRFVLQRLGISEEDLDAMVNSEVDELLHTMHAERRQENLIASSSVELPCIMSKEDCMTLFNATGVPPPGALWGVYRWAANLGETKFNFEREDDNAFLDAYD